MRDFVVVLTLALLAGLIALMELLRSRWQDLGAWAVLLLALALIVDRL